MEYVWDVVEHEISSMMPSCQYETKSLMNVLSILLKIHHKELRLKTTGSNPKLATYT